jgi:hypothetical protein
VKVVVEMGAVAMGEVETVEEAWAAVVRVAEGRVVAATDREKAGLAAAAAMVHARVAVTVAAAEVEAMVSSLIVVCGCIGLDSRLKFQVVQESVAVSA